MHRRAAAAAGGTAGAGSTLAIRMTADLYRARSALAGRDGWLRLISCSLLLGLLPGPGGAPGRAVVKSDPEAADRATQQRAQRLLAQYQCAGCHLIPGVTGADGQRGPALARFGRRSYIAGALPNEPAVLARWIIDPNALLPGTPMPAMGVTLADAAVMAAYLGSLR